MPVSINRIVWGRDRLMKFEDRLATKYTIEVSLDAKQWQLVCTQEDRLQRKSTPEVETKRASLLELEKQRKGKEKEADEIRNRLTVYCGSFKTPEKVHLLKRGDPMQKLLLDEMLAELQLAEARRRRLVALMAQEVASDRSLLQLMRLLGVRHIIAFAIAAVVGDITRFANPKKLVAYLGLTPSVADSGETIRGRGELVSFGRKDLRPVR